MLDRVPVPGEVVVISYKSFSERAVYLKEKQETHYYQLLGDGLLGISEYEDSTPRPKGHIIDMGFDYYSKHNKVIDWDINWPEEYNPVTARAVSEYRGGEKCKCCGSLNPDAVSNQSDGTYLCYECRS